MSPANKPQTISYDIEELSQKIVHLERRISELERKVPASPKTPVLPKYFYHGDNCTLDPNITLWAPTEDRKIQIGNNCTIRRGAEWIGPITIGDRTVFNRDSYIRSNVTIGSRVNIGAFVKFITDSHEVGGTYRRAGKGSFPPIIVGDATWIGAGSIILGGVTIGTGAVIAAGSVVNTNIPDHTLVGGVPAKKIRQLPH